MPARRPTGGSGESDQSAARVSHAGPADAEDGGDGSRRCCPLPPALESVRESVGASGLSVQLQRMASRMSLYRSSSSGRGGDSGLSSRSASDQFRLAPSMKHFHNILRAPSFGSGSDRDGSGLSSGDPSTKSGADTTGRTWKAPYALNAEHKLGVHTAIDVSSPGDRSARTAGEGSGRVDKLEVPEDSQRIAFSTRDGHGFGARVANVFLSREEYKQPEKRAESWLVVLFLVTYTLGLGVCDISFVFAGAGYLCGLLLILGIGLAFYWTATLLISCRQKLPGAVSLADLVGYLFGPQAMVATQVYVNFSLVVVLVQYLNLMGYCLRIVFKNVPGNTIECSLVWSTIACLALLPVFQFRTFHASKFTIIFSVFMLVVALGTWTIVMFVKGVDPDSAPSTFLPIPMKVLPDTDSMLSNMHLFNKMALVNFSFAFHPSFLEIISEMKHPKHATAVLRISTGIVAAVVITIGIIGYWHVGNSSYPFIFSDLTNDPSVEGFRPGNWAAALSVFAYFLHMSMSSVLRAVHVLRSLLLYLDPENLTRDTWRGHLTWFVLSVLLLILTFAISAAIPFYGVLEEYISAVFFIPVCIVLPMVCYWKLQGKSSRGRLNVAQKVVFSVIILVALGCAAYSLACAIYETIHFWRGLEPEHFACMTEEQLKQHFGGDI